MNRGQTILVSIIVYSIFLFLGLSMYNTVYDKLNETEQDLMKAREKNDKLELELRESTNKLAQLESYVGQNKYLATTIEERLRLINDKLRAMNISINITQLDTLSAVQDSQKCIVPKLDPFDESILQFVTAANVPVCSNQLQNRPVVTILDDSYLKKNSKVSGSFDAESECSSVTYQSIEFGINDNKISVSQANTLYGTTKIENDFIFSQCDVSDQSSLKSVFSGKKSLRTFHAQIHEKSAAIERATQNLAELKKSSGAPKEKPYNILLVGFDSTSHANFYRQIPKTIRYLRSKFTWANEHDENLNVMRTKYDATLKKRGEPLINETITKTDDVVIFEMNGYSIVGDGTTAQLAAILTGSREEDMYEARARVSGSRHIDDWPWIFKHLNNYGYVTLHAEDEPNIGAFQFRLKGWQKQPTDHYMRPFWIQYEAYMRDLMSSTVQCRGGTAKLYHEAQLLWAKEYFHKYDGIPKFAFTYSKAPHDDANMFKVTDDFLAEYFKNLYEENIMDDTFVIFFGDHGSRFGPLRQTAQGKLEERLPLHLMFTPKRFLENHPVIAQNLNTNQQRLTTPFDVHATIMHILELPYRNKEDYLTPVSHAPYQVSFFDRIPEERVCGDAAIADHWCICQEWTNMEVSDQYVQSGSQKMVDYINQLLEKDGEGRCVLPLQLDHVNFAQKLHMNDKLTQFAKSQDRDGRVAEFKEDALKHNTMLIQAQFVTTPGNGVFEGTFRLDIINEDGRKEAIYTVEPNFSRVNAYGEQPCSPKPHMRQFCLCEESRDS